MKAKQFNWEYNNLEYSNSIIISCYGFIVTTSLKIIQAALQKVGRIKSSTHCVFETTIKFILLYLHSQNMGFGPAFVLTI